MNNFMHMLANENTVERNHEWLFETFAVIGIAVSIVAAVIAVVWLTCFVVKLLIKTFGEKVQASYDVMSEDIAKKAEAKKIRNEKKRAQKSEHKMEVLTLKLESAQKIHEIKTGKISAKLAEKEQKAKEKYLAKPANNEMPKVEKPVQEKEKKVEEKPVQEKEPKEQTKKKKEVEEKETTTDENE